METNNSKKKVKEFDAVKMMREIRDKISAETQNMSFEELNKYIKQKLNSANSKLIGTK
jgi:predicted nucleic acid-binding OB-fold protein